MSVIWHQFPHRFKKFIDRVIVTQKGFLPFWNIVCLRGENNCLMSMYTLGVKS